jgi:hypothetical protein
MSTVNHLENDAVSTDIDNVVRELDLKTEPKIKIINDIVTSIIGK